MTRLSKLLLIVALTLPSTASAITYRPDISDTKVLKWGEEHECVLRIQGKACTTSFKCSGSCVMIGPNVAITAAHVMDDMKDAVVVDDKGDEHEILAAIAPDGWDVNTYGYDDIAVIYIKEPVKLPFYPGLYEGDDEVGKVCSIAGWGRHGTFNSGYEVVRHSGWRRRAGSNVVDSVDRDLLSISPTKRGQKRMTTLEAIISPGDSGGGMFIDGKVAGIHSVLATDKMNSPLNGGYNCYSGSTRVSKYHKWIKRNAEHLRNFYRLVDQVNKTLGQ